MSSAIILRAASANFFWSTGADAGAAPELELGLELELGGKDGLGEDNSLLDAEVCWGRATALTFWGSFCLLSFSFSGVTCSKASRETSLNVDTNNNVIYSGPLLVI